MQAKDLLGRERIWSLRLGLNGLRDGFEILKGWRVFEGGEENGDLGLQSLMLIEEKEDTVLREAILGLFGERESRRKKVGRKSRREYKHCFGLWFEIGLGSWEFGADLYYVELLKRKREKDTW